MNYMITMQNQIIGEKLKGLNESFTSLVFKKNSENVLCEEFEILTNNMKVLCFSYQDMENRLLTNISENLSLRNDLIQIQNDKSDVLDQLNKITSKAKDRIKYLSEEIKNINLEKEKQKLQLEVSEKNNKILADEYEHLKSKLKQLKSRKNLDDENTDEKICQLCKRVYKESENYNWSCKVHASQYVNEYWWCCGKKGENAPGCKASRHETKEEETEFVGEENLIVKTHFLCSVRDI